MKIETNDGPIKDLADIANIPLIPGPEEVGIPGICESTLDGIGEPEVKVRPSLDVAIENLANLTKHVAPFCGRLRSWDTRLLTGEMEVRFKGAVEDLAASFVRLTDQLTALRSVGFVAKTTPMSRMRSKLQLGSKVRIDSKNLSAGGWETMFTAEQLNSLEVERLTGKHAFLKAGDGTSIGAVKLTCIELA
jgi:hypothetical protein